MILVYGDCVSVRSDPKATEKLFREIIIEYLWDLHRYVAFCGRFTLSKQDVEDIAQEVLFRLIREMTKAVDEKNWTIKFYLPAWLFLVAKRIVVDHQRKAGRVQEIEFDETFIAPKSPQYVEKLAVRKAFLELSEDQQFMLLAREQGNTIEDIAKMFDLPASKIAYEIRKAIETLREKLA